MSATAALLAPQPVIPGANTPPSAAESQRARAAAEKSRDRVEENDQLAKAGNTAEENTFSSLLDETQTTDTNPLLFASPALPTNSGTAPSLSVEQGVDVTAATPPRPFNWDPAMLVVDTTTQNVSAPANEGFDANLIQALTPGLAANTGTQAMPEQTIKASAAQNGATIASAMRNNGQSLPSTLVTTPPVSAQDTQVALTASGLSIPALSEAANLTTDTLRTASPNSGLQQASVVTLKQADPQVVTTAAATVSTDSVGKQWFKRDAGNTPLSGFDGEVNVNGTATPKTDGYIPSHLSANGTARLSMDTALAMQGNMTTASADAAATADTALFGDMLADDSAMLLTTSAANTSGGLQAGTLASTLGHTSSASAAHPASQVIAATLQSVAGDKPKSFSMALNPAELGRVIVDMQMDSDKKMKIVMTVENDSTYHLLQRDQSSLQGILDKAGLAQDTEISFQLASDQQSFDQAAGDRQPFQQDNNPSWRVADKLAADDAATQASMNALTETTGGGSGRWQVNRLV